MVNNIEIKLKFKTVTTTELSLIYDGNNKDLYEKMKYIQMYKDIFTGPNLTGTHIEERFDENAFRTKNYEEIIENYVPNSEKSIYPESFTVKFNDIEKRIISDGQDLNKEHVLQEFLDSIEGMDKIREKKELNTLSTYLDHFY